MRVCDGGYFVMVSVLDVLVNRLVGTGSSVTNLKRPMIENWHPRSQLKIDAVNTKKITATGDT